MKCFFTADLHGKSILYSQLDEEIEKESPEILVLGGDLFPESDDVQEIPNVQKTFIEEELKPRFRKYLKNKVKEILIILGNHDLLLCQNEIEEMEKDGLCFYIHNKRHSTFNNIDFMGYSFSPPSPYILRDFDKKDFPEEEVSELCLLKDNKGFINEDMKMIEINNKELFNERNTIKEDLQKLIPLTQLKPFIFVCHAPPFSKYLDAERPDIHVGSKSVTDFIKKTKPVLSLHGHIHFSPKNSGAYKEKIGDTLCVQPGQKFSDLYGVYFNTENPQNTVRHVKLS